MSDASRAPLMADVARLAGVSIMTVSRVLNGHASVTPATRSRVERAVDRLGYRPNTAARTLASGRSATLGVVSVETPYYGPASTLFGIEAAARAIGLFVSFVAVRDADETRMRAALDHLRAMNVDGIIVVAPVHSALETLDNLAVDVPIVVLQGVPGDAMATVGIDQEAGARAATRHLLDLGHRTVHHIRGPSEWLEAEARALAGVRRQQAAEHADGRGLAAAVGAEEAHDDAAGHFDGEIIDDGLAAEALGEAVHADGGRGAVHGCTGATSTGWPTCKVSARSFGRASTIKTRRERSSRL
jgi:DNA-binding LacI/PurR family transcriptional regulator